MHFKKKKKIKLENSQTPGSHSDQIMLIRAAASEGPGGLKPAELVGPSAAVCGPTAAPPLRCYGGICPSEQIVTAGVESAIQISAIDRKYFE